MSLSETPTPTKPPRGQGRRSSLSSTTPVTNTTSRETGILMTVIKALLSSDSSAQRDQIKASLEAEYRTLDKNLDGLISQKQESLNTVMQTFREVCNHIDLAKGRVSSVKGNLQRCKSLLHCRREELERLYIEGIEHKHALELLEKIDKVRDVPQQYNKAINRRHYLVAAESLVSGLFNSNELIEIEGLQDLYKDLVAKKEKLYAILLDELNTEIFTKTAPEVIVMKRQGSGLFSPFTRTGSDRQSSGKNKINQIRARKIYLDVSTPVNGINQTNDCNEIENESAIMMIIKCMSLLQELQRFKEDLKNQLEEKLLGSINAISQQIIDYSECNDSSEPDSVLLVHFLQLTFSQFRAIEKYHVKMIREIKKEEKRNTLPSTVPYSSFNETDLWNKFQIVLQSTLKLYFDLSDSSKSPTASASSKTATIDVDINNYFAKKKPQRQKKLPLFKFEYSLHGLNIGDMNSDHADQSLLDKHRFLVVRPNPRNIIYVYNTVQEFIVEVEDALNGQKCDLRKFMAININRIFVQQIYKEISDAVELSKRNPDLFRETISLEESKNLKYMKKPVLQSVSMIGQNILDVLSLAKDLPSHADQLLRLLDPVLTSYREVVLEFYSTLLRGAEENSVHKKLISATMVMDEDIERLLKSLPNWNKLMRRKQMGGRTESVMDEVGDESVALAGGRGSSISKTSIVSDLRSNNSSREADLFFGLFGGKVVNGNEIITDMKLLQQIGNLHESMEWLSTVITSVIVGFESQISTKELQEPISKLRALALLFQELADTCVLLLYLEIRVHSFYYLSPISQKSDFAPGVDSQIPDSEVVQLTKDLSDIETVLSSSLQPIKCKYVFEGLGQLIGTVLIRAAQDLRRINENGVKRMCRNIFSIQQLLCNITNEPEHSLDIARQYYELFLHPVEELFDSILEKGPVFKEIEYMSAVQLLYRSRSGGNREQLSDHLTRLSNILGDLGVTV